MTLTLPDDVLDALAAVDADLSRAVVRVMQPQMAVRPHPAAELTVFGRRAVILVNPSRALEERTGVMLVPLSDGRALISFDPPMTIAQLELRIQDAVDDPRLPRDEARVFEDIGRILRNARRTTGVGLVQKSIIVVETRKAPRRVEVAAPRKSRRL